MQFGAVEAGCARAPRGLREQRRQLVRQRPDVRQVQVVDRFARAEVQGLQVTRVKHPRPPLGAQVQQRLPGRRLVLPGKSWKSWKSGTLQQGRRQGQVALEKGARLGPATDAQEVDQLHEQARVATAGLVHGAGQATQPVDMAVVPDAQQRAAGHVADPGGLDDDGTGPAAGETRIPLHDILGDLALLVGAPGHHRRHPGAVAQRQGPDTDGAEQPRGAGLRDGRHAAVTGDESDAFSGFPHGRRSMLGALQDIRTSKRATASGQPHGPCRHDARRTVATHLRQLVRSSDG